jgi:hypothetical protein
VKARQSFGGLPFPVCAELVEAPFFFPALRKKMRPFDKLRANGSFLME